MMRAFFLLLFLMFTLSACGSRANDPWLATVRAALSGDESATDLPLREQQARTRAAIRDSDFAGPVLMVTLPKRSAVATMVIVSETPQGVTWMDGSGIAVTLLHGVVISTRGLGHDVMASDVTGTLAAMQGAQGVYSIRRKALDSAGALRNQEMTCSAHRTAGTLEETCAASGVTAQNRFEQGQRGITASRQWLGAPLGYVELERLR